jgi:hypothetical protein
MPRKKHSKPEIEKALCYAEFNHWRVEVGGSHAWGKIYCPYYTNSGTMKNGMVVVIHTG